MKTVNDRFVAKINIRNLHSCWEWTRATDKDGYGLFQAYSKQWKAHRFSWKLYKGEIPNGLCVLHKCDNPPCVNPFHLFLGTAADNNKDKCRKKRDHESKKTHCPKGHLYSKDNTLFIGGARRCRTCNKAFSKRYYYVTSKRGGRDL